MIGADSEIVIEDFDNERKFTRCKFAYKSTGGLHMNSHGDDKVTEVLSVMAKKIARKILEGKPINMMKMPKPMVITHTLTYLQCIANDFVYAADYLIEAAKQESALERMKLVVTSMVASLHKNTSIVLNKTPLDPIIGETLQVNKSSGVEFCCEQVWNEPAATRFFMTDPEKKFKVYGKTQVGGTISMNKLRGKNFGYAIIEIGDKSKIRVTSPEMEIKGLLLGDRVMNHCSKFIFEDTINKLIAEVTFQEEDGNFSKIKGWFSSQKKLPLDHFNLNIYQIHGEKNAETRGLLASGSGSWLEYVQIDNKVLWRYDDKLEEWQNSDIHLLYSDTTLREDRLLLLQNKIQEAQSLRDKLENMENKEEEMRRKKR